LINFKKLILRESRPPIKLLGLKNVTREDKIDETRMLSQKEALSQAKKTHKGFFVVPAVIHKS